uniref:DNA polymerase eta n=1 Tax=Timema bartmani TaxID=61472 RepID=A0A7R9EVS1_9NEOP|nr:unnamed protein product [Timema bartmani]
MCERIIALIDMDCFFCQVEERLDPSLKGKPMAVVQYNKIIAVNYEARAFGVSRHHRGDVAKQKCKDIILVSVPSDRGKADGSKYRDAGREVIDVLCQFSDCVERASVDEAYLDITRAVEKRLKEITEVQPSQLANTFVDLVQMRLAVGAVLIEEIREAVYKQTSFRCSAGIAHNKILGKLVCGLHKPNRQTVLPHSGVESLYQTLPIKKIRSLGGKFGDEVVNQLGCKLMADLARFTEKQLQQKFDDKTGTWLYNIAQGIDHEPVTQRLVAKSIGCCKKFPGKQALGTKEGVEKWLLELASEVSGRLAKDFKENKRRAQLLTVSYSQDIDGKTVSSSRSGILSSYEPPKIKEEALELIKKSNATPSTLFWNPPVKFLGISVGKFVKESLLQTKKIDSFFKTGLNKGNSSSKNNAEQLEHLEHSKPTHSREIVYDKNNMEENFIDVQEEMSKCLDGLEVCSKSSENAIVFNENQSLHCNLVKNDQIFSLSIDDHASVNSVSKKTKNCNYENVSLSKASSTTKHLNKIKEKICYSFNQNENDDESKDTQHSTLMPASSFKDDIHDTQLTKKLKVTNEDPQPSTSFSLDDNNEGAFISLDEIFPRLSQADRSILELLPSTMQKEYLATMTKKNSRKTTSQKSFETKSLDDLNLSSCQPLKECTVEADIHTNNESIVSNSRLFSFLNKEDKPNYSKRLERSRTSEEVNPFQNKNNNFSKHVDLRECREDSIDSITVEPRVNLVNDELFSKINFYTKSNNNSDVENEIEEINPNTESVNSSINIVSEESNESPLEVDENYQLVKEMCAQCNKLIPLIDFSEHLDFHSAQDLHRQLNSASGINGGHPKPTSNRGTSIKDAVNKKKRGRVSRKQNTMIADKKIRSITSFFVPK